jgi:AmmeMemoRadiSam system protein B
LGEVSVDEELALGLLAGLKDELAADPHAHAQEHSLEVQLPFIKYFFPGAKIVPIRIAANSGAAALGAKIGEQLKKSGKKVAVIGTTDLTHYGDTYGFSPAGYGEKAYAWMQNNDLRIIKLALSLEADAIVAEAAAHYNACGAGAMAATVAAAAAMGAQRGIQLEYTTSHAVSGEKDFYMGVGYAGLIFTE